MDRPIRAAAIKSCLCCHATQAFLRTGFAGDRGVTEPRQRLCVYGQSNFTEPALRLGAAAGVGVSGIPSLLSSSDDSSDFARALGPAPSLSTIHVSTFRKASK